MNTDYELAAWREIWQSEEEAPSSLHIDLRQMVEKQRRRMLAQRAFGLTFGCAMLVFSAVIAYREHTVERIAWAAVIWVLTFTAAGFSIWNSLGLWTADQESTSAFIALSRQRCIAALRMIRFGQWFVALELAIVLPWLALRATHSLLPFVLTIALAAAYLAVFTWYRRRKRKELESLDRLEESLTER